MPPRRRSARRQAERQQAQAGGSPQPGTGARRRAPKSVRAIPKAFLIVGGLLLAAIAILVIADYWVSIKRPGDEPILAVNKRVFTWNDYVELLKFQKLGTQAMGGEFNAGQAPYQLMETMTEGQLIRDAAPRLGLKVTDDQVRKEMISRLVPDAQDQSDPDQINREFKVRLHDYLTQVQISEAAYEEIVRTDVLRDQLRDKLGVAIPRVQPQAHIYLMSVSNDDETKAEEQLKQGVDFTTVARRFSTDDTRPDGGDIGWVPRLAYKDLDLQIFGLRENSVSDPISADKGYWVIKVLERQGEKAHLKGILVDGIDTARSIDDKLNSGFTFEDLAAQLSVDPDTKSKRGDMGWVSAGAYKGLFDDYIRGAPLNKFAGPITLANGTQFLLVVDRKEALEVSDRNFDVLKTRALEDWISQERDANQIDYCPGDPEKNCFSNLKVDRALDQIDDISRTRLQQDATATAAAASRGQQQIPGLG